MIMESIVVPLAKGMFGSALGIGATWGSGYVIYKKFLTPHPLQEILEERTQKSFSRSSLVSATNKGKGVTEIRYKIPSGLSVIDMLNLVPAIENKLDCECNVHAEDKNFIFTLSSNPIPKKLVFEPKKIKKKLADYEFAMYLGESRQGSVIFDFTKNSTPHLLFGGPTGKGKSNLVNQGICSMLERYTPKELQLVLIDLKDGVELGVYRNLPHVRNFLETTHAVSGELDLLDNEIKRRNDLFKSLGVKKLSTYNEKAKEKLPRILVVADEFAQFANIAENDERKDIYIKWQKILQKGRSTGIHVMAGTQVTDADVFPKQIKGNIDARFGFKFSDPQHSKMITGGSELTRLPEIMGRGLLKLGDNLTETQTAEITDEVLEQIVAKHMVKEAEVIEVKEEKQSDKPFKWEYVNPIKETVVTDTVKEREEPIQESEPIKETNSIEDLFISEEELKKKPTPATA